MKMRYTLAAIVPLLVLAGCSGSGDPATSDSPSTTDSAGTGMVYGHLAVAADTSTFADLIAAGSAPSDGDTCTASAATPDVIVGAAVVITDKDGATVGEGTLIKGELVTGTDEVGLTDAKCDFSFTATGVQRGKGEYTVTVANQPGQTFSEEDVFHPIEMG